MPSNALLGAVFANRNMLAQATNARESQFQAGIKATPWYQQFTQNYGEQPNLNDPDYNYRAAWSAGLRPQQYAPDNNRYHWPSALPSGAMLKSENHPTAWMEHFMRATGVDPNTVGVKSPEQATNWLNRR